MRRMRTVLAVAAGGTMALTLGTGFIALLSDSVTSPGNDISSGVIAASTAHDVKAAIVDETTDCDAMTVLQDGPLPVAVTGTTISLEGGTYFQPTDFCIRNDGTAPARLLGSISSVVDTELDCAVGEAEAGDATCGTGDGELSPVLLWSMPTWTPPNVQTAYTSQSCLGNTNVQSFVMPGAVELDATLDPGETCRIYLAVSTDGAATQDAKLVAQTDQLQFDIVFTLEDPV